MTDAEKENHSVIEKSTLPSESYTLKVLFGPLYGTELNLPAKTWLLITGREQEVSYLTQDMPQACQFVDNVLHIPGNAESPNIRLFLTEEESDNHDALQSFKAEVLSADHISEHWINENSIFEHSGLVFSVKKTNDCWADEVINYHPSQALHILPVQKEATYPQPSNKFKLLCGGLLLLSLLVAGGGFLYKQNHSPIPSLTSILSGTTGPVKLLTGRDGKIYALTEQYRDKQWVQETLYKSTRYQDVISVFLPQKQREIVSRLLLQKVPALQLIMDHPEQPVLQVVGSLDPKESNDLRLNLLKEIPFARDVVITSVEGNVLCQQARDNLKKMHLLYQEIHTANGYAFIINDKLSDSALYKMQKFTHDFYRQWGNSFITFDINLDESWLEGKSYLAAQNGYLYINQHHWLFPASQ